MDKQSLLCFVTVAESLNYSRAAEKLYITQPAISRQIFKLEKQLGCQLFYRNTHEVSLTPSGMIALESAERILYEYDVLINNMSDCNQGFIGSLRIAYGGRSHVEYLTKAMSLIQKYYPSVNTVIRRGNIEEIKRGLRTGEDDAILLFRTCISDHETDLEWTLVSKYRFSAILPMEHHLAKRDSIALSELSNESFVSSVRDQSPQIYEERLKVCMKAGFVPNIVEHVPTADEVVMTVGVKGYVGLLTSGAVDPCIPNISVIPIDDYMEGLDIIIAWRKGDQNPCIPILVKALLGQINERGQA